MKQNIKYFIIIGVIVILAVGSLIISKVSKHVPQNPPGTVGNTAGNLNNGGLFCEDDGVVYFANSYDNGALYSMSPDETNFKKLVEADVKSINAGGNNLYYYMADSSTSTGLGFVRKVVGVYRCKKNGTAVSCISRDPAEIVMLADSALFYQHYDNTYGFRLYRVNIDGSNEQVISDKIVNPAGYYKGKIYYNETEGSQFLYSLDTTTLAVNEELKYNVWNPIRVDDYVYFMDVRNDYRLCRYNLSTEETDIVTSDRIDNYNIAGNYVFYICSDPKAPALKRVSLDDGTIEIVAEGNYTDLNVTSRYLYFRQFGDEYKTYHTPIAGTINVTEFSAAAMGVKIK